MPTPALTPAEWRAATGDLDWTLHALIKDEHINIIAKTHHAVAALALYKQPFGFSRDDVIAAQRAGLYSLADRIQALLPH